jgi:glucose-6-phosphate isomerase
MGAPGTDAQHSFFQLLHQGTKLVPVDFVTAFKASAPEESSQQTALITNMIAQMEALLVGRDSSAVNAELAAKNMEQSPEVIVPRIIPGNKPSTAIIMKQLTPRALGALLAAYENKTLVVGAIYGINSFDQFGVELGKTLASKLLKELGKDKPVGNGHDGSTNALITLFNETQ